MNPSDHESQKIWGSNTNSHDKCDTGGPGNVYFSDLHRWDLKSGFVAVVYSGTTIGCSKFSPSVSDEYNRSTITHCETKSVQSMANVLTVL